MNKTTALIVEDDPTLSTIFSQALQAAGYETAVALDGLSALAYLKESTPDVIILDLHLPGVSGEDILLSIRSSERLKDSKVIIASANHQMARRLEPNAELVLIKPVSFHQLRLLSARLRPEQE